VSRQRRDAAAATAIGLGLIPLLLVSARLHSAYGFFDRYYTPFFGLGFVTLLLALDAARRVLPRRRPWLAAAAAILLLAWQGAGKDLAGLVPGFKNLRQPPRNFSPYFRIYEDIKREPGPLLLIHSHCHGEDIPLMYLQYVGRPYTEGYTIIDAMHCATERLDGRLALERFVAVHPEGLIVLDDKERDRSDPRAPRGDWEAKVRRVPSEPVSVWLIRGARSVGEVRRIARAVGFDSIELFWKAP
jgi:hypothetical protein